MPPRAKHRAGGAGVPARIPASLPSGAYRHKTWPLPAEASARYSRAETRSAVTAAARRQEDGQNGKSRGVALLKCPDRLIHRLHPAACRVQVTPGVLLAGFIPGKFYQISLPQQALQFKPYVIRDNARVQQRLYQFFSREVLRRDIKLAL